MGDRRWFRAGYLPRHWRERGRRAEVTGQSVCSKRRCSAHLCKPLRIGSSLFCGLCRARGEKVASDDGKIGEELAGFRIGDEELREGSEVLYSSLCIALRVVLGGEVAAVADAGLGLVFCRLPEAFIRSVPDELLEDFVCVFVLDLEAGLRG